MYTQGNKIVFSVFHLSFFQLNLHTVSDPNVLFRKQTRIGKKDSVARAKTNRSILTAIIKSIEFCERKAVRSYRDNGVLNSSDISKKSAISFCYALKT